MALLIEIIFWFCGLCILHSYVLFPIILYVLAQYKKQNTIIYDAADTLPFVSIVIAAYNEEQVIEEKIKSIFNTSYPHHLFDVHIGSDNSSDATNSIIQTYCAQYSNLHLHAFTTRQGKAQIINTLTEQAKGSIIVLTDANVYFEYTTLYELVKHYKNEDIALVGGLIINTNVKKTGISYQEKTYLTFENTIKYREGVIWGTMIGAFGGVYSIRKEYYHPVPKNYFMDDFYITMHVLQDGKKAILEPKAVCFEDISNIIYEEFRRKVRISIGNFQNLQTFKSLAYNIFTGLGFSFVSHKILRWLTPFFLIICFVLSGVLAIDSILYLYVFTIQLLLMFIPLVDFVLQKFSIHIKVIRFITHFYSMNLALFLGFFKYLKGINSNVWQPTKRNQN